MTPNRFRCIVVIFSCRRCYSIYEAVQEHAQGHGKFDCAECGARVHSWCGDYRFTDWLAVAAFGKSHKLLQLAKLH